MLQTLRWGSQNILCLLLGSIQTVLEPSGFAGAIWQQKGMEKAEISLKVLKPSNFSVPHVPLSWVWRFLNSSLSVHPLSVPGMLLMLSVTSSRCKRAKERCWRGFSTGEKEFICRSERAFLTGENNLVPMCLTWCEELHFGRTASRNYPPAVIAPLYGMCWSKR